MMPASTRSGRWRNELNPFAPGATPQARVWHRRDHLCPLRRCGTDSGQHRRTRNHPRPLRETWRDGGSALLAASARSARGGRVRPRSRKPILSAVEGPRAKTRRRHDAAASRRAALGPLSGIDEKCPWTATLRACAKPKPTRGRPNPHPRSGQAGPCAPDAYPADCSKRAFELPDTFTQSRRHIGACSAYA